MRTDIINWLIKEYEYESYLEIGVGKGQNFKHIECELKHGVDPNMPAEFRMTSDEFFAATNKQYDLIFIDGLHRDYQVIKDVHNALLHLKPGGVIVMHDCSPRNEQEQQVPRGRGQRIWTGDVWKAFVHFRQKPDLEMYVVDCNNGIGVVRPGTQKPLQLSGRPLEWKDLEQNKAGWLNLKTPQEFKQYERKRHEIRKYKPVSERLMHKVHGRAGTICEHLREIYSKIDDENLRYKVRICMAQAKAMNQQLHKYKRDKWAAQHQSS